MHLNRVTKSCQSRRAIRAERLRELLRLAPSDSILLDACRRKKASDVEALLSAFPGLNPDTIRDAHLRTPLHIACARTDDFQEATAIARLLISAGSDVNNGVGDIDGLQPMHMAVLAGNIQCVLMLLEQGASIPASDPFRLTPLLLAKLKMDNLRRTRLAISNQEEDDLERFGKSNRVPASVQAEYKDLRAITEVLVNHLAHKHITTFGYPLRDEKPHYHGLSDFLFAKEEETEQEQLNQAIVSLTDQLSGISVQERRSQDEHRPQCLQDAMNVLLEKVRNLNIEETAVN